MPRDLTPNKEKTAEEMAQITRSPDPVDEQFPGGLEDGVGATLEEILSQRNSKRDELHPYVQTLNLSDIESCVKLEDETFPAAERCTREKFQYRLAKCAELSMGIFTSHAENQIVTAETASPVYSGAPERKAALLGHIIATKTTNPTVHDGDMEIPDSSDPQRAGHQEDGRTVCIHSLAVLPTYQRRGLGKTLIKAYIQRMESHGVADRIALIAHEEMIPYYEALGFENQGPSEAKFAGGGWFNLVRELKSEKELMLDEME